MKTSEFVPSSFGMDSKSLMHIMVKSGLCDRSSPAEGPTKSCLAKRLCHARSLITLMASRFPGSAPTNPSNAKRFLPVTNPFIFASSLSNLSSGKGWLTLPPVYRVLRQIIIHDISVVWGAAGVLAGSNRQRPCGCHRALTLGHRHIYQGAYREVSVNRFWRNAKLGYLLCKHGGSLHITTRIKAPCICIRSA